MKLATPHEVVLNTFYTTFPHLEDWHNFQVAADIAENWANCVQYHYRKDLVCVWYVHDNPIDREMLWQAVQYSWHNRWYYTSLQENIYKWLQEYYPIYVNKKLFNHVDEIKLFTNDRSWYKSCIDINRDECPFDGNDIYNTLWGTFCTRYEVESLRAFYQLFGKYWFDFGCYCRDNHIPENAETYLEWRINKKPAPKTKEQVLEAVAEYKKRQWGHWFEDTTLAPLVINY